MTTKKTPLQMIAEARAISHALGYRVFFQEPPRTNEYRVFRRLPNGNVTPLIRTKSEKTLLDYMMKQLPAKHPLRVLEAKTNPAPRSSHTKAVSMATRFTGRAPDKDEYARVKKPQLPDAMTCIGEISAIEYIAERDGKDFIFRHAFKEKSRPHLVVDPDGKNLALMLGGAWQFTENGFVDKK